MSAQNGTGWKLAALVCGVLQALGLAILLNVWSDIRTLSREQAAIGIAVGKIEVRQQANTDRILKVESDVEVLRAKLNGGKLTP